MATCRKELASLWAKPWLHADLKSSAIIGPENNEVDSNWTIHYAYVKSDCSMKEQLQL